MNMFQFWGSLPSYEKGFFAFGFWGIGMSAYLIQRGEPVADGEGGVEQKIQLVPSI